MYSTNKTKAILLCFIFILAPQFGQAEITKDSREIKPGTLFYKYLTSKFLANELYKYVVYTDQRLGVNSNEQYQITPGKVSVIVPVKFTETEEHPSEGVWFHRIPLTGAGETRTYNVYFVAKINSPPQVNPMIMGNTNASILLVKDTFGPFQLREYTATYKKHCNKEEFQKTFIIYDSNVIALTDNKFPQGSWKEIWSAQACGKQSSTEILFQPDGKGGTHYTIDTISFDQTKKINSNQSLNSTPKSGAN